MTMATHVRHHPSLLAKTEMRALCAEKTRRERAA